MIGVDRPSGLSSRVCTYCGHVDVAPYAIERGDTRAELLRYKAWANRLASKKSDVSTAEVEALVRIGPPAVAPLSEILYDKRVSERAKAAAATALGRIGGPDAVNTLLDVLARQERLAERRRKRGPYIVIGFVALILVTTVLPLAFGAHGVGANAGGFAGIITALVAAQAVNLRKSAAGALGALKEPRAVGPLALAANEKQLAPTALPVLRDLLPQVTEEHVAAYTIEERAAIIALLRQKDYKIVLGALPVVGMFGAEDAREPVERILREGPDLLRVEAEKTLSKIRGRIEVEKDKQTLLRASTSVDGIPSETLLRSAAALPDPEPTQLLRSSDNSGEAP